MHTHPEEKPRAGSTHRVAMPFL